MELDKTNFIRFLDVALIGPLMIYAAARPLKPDWARNVLWLSGVGTILYNGYNLLVPRS